MSGTYVFTLNERERLARFLSSNAEAAAEVTGVSWFCLERAQDGRFVMEEAATQILLAVASWERES